MRRWANYRLLTSQHYTFFLHIAKANWKARQTDSDSSKRKHTHTQRGRGREKLIGNLGREMMVLTT